MSKIIIIHILVFCCFLSGNTQDPHFSQFNSSGIYLNPAMGGVFDGHHRFTINYHDQWSNILSTPYRTISASAEFRYHIANDDFFALHFNGFFDQVGNARYSQGMLQLGGSYIKKLTGGYGAEQYLAAGFQIGSGQNSINWGNLWYSRQFDIGRTRIDTSIPDGENIFTNNGTSDFYLNANLGLMYYVVFEDNRSIYAGFAAHHLNEPSISLRSGAESDPTAVLDRRWTLNAGGELPMSSSLSVLPSAILLKQGPFRQMNLGTSLRFSGFESDELALRTGMYLRAVKSINSSISMDALVFLVGLEKNNWNANLSYDVTVSSLSNFNQSRGAFELSFIYTNPYERRKASISCPKF